MTTYEAMRLARSRGIRFFLAPGTVFANGSKEVVDELGPLLADHMDDIAAVLEEHEPGSRIGGFRGSSTDAVHAASLLVVKRT